MAVTTCRWPPEIRAQIPGEPTTTDVEQCTREVIDKQVNELQAKWKRYRDYVGILMVKLPHHLTTQIGIINGKRRTG